MQVIKGPNNYVAGAPQAMGEFRAMCRTIFRRERSVQTIVATSCRCCDDMLSPKFRWQGLADESRPLGFGALIESQIVVISNLRGMAHHRRHGEQIAIAQFPEPVFHSLS